VWALVDTANAESFLRRWADAGSVSAPRAEGFISQPGPAVIAFELLLSPEGRGLG